MSDVPRSPSTPDDESPSGVTPDAAALDPAGGHGEHGQGSEAAGSGGAGSEGGTPGSSGESGPDGTREAQTTAG